jgi:hypothetical protein
MLHVKGNFVDAARVGYTPNLVVNGKQYPAQGSTTPELIFPVPVADLFPVAIVTDATKFQSATLALTVPWREPRILGLWHTDHTDTFKVIVGALPASPGKLTLVHTVIQ